MIQDLQRFEAAIAAIDAANAEDPNVEVVDGRPFAKELLYAQRMSEMLDRYAPDAPEAVRLAARAQHIQRWKSPRSAYPMDRQGYLQWRTGLYRFHADTAAQILREVGYDNDTIAHVSAAIGKKDLKVKPETQLLEDVIGLVFLEHYLADFAVQHADYDEEKWLRILRRTWSKMSPRGREFALAGKVGLPEPLVPLIRKAVD